MLRRIVLQNYMSHGRTVIEPAEGLTILVGPNNCGKSAVVSALQTLCSNLTGDFMVRHGERECSVTVETTDGHSITWQRKGSTVSYVINGEEVNRLRGGVPDRLHEILRLPMVRSAENGEDEFDIHFGTQKAPLFLINEPERRAAMFFAASSDAALLMQMQKRHTEKVKDSRRERDRLEKERVQQDRKLAALNPLGELSNRLQRAEQEHQTLSALDAQLSRLASELVAISREENNWSRRCAELFALAPLQAPYSPTDTEPLKLLSGSIACILERLELESDESQVLAHLREAPALNDAMALGSACAAIVAESDTWRCAAAIDSAIGPLTPLPEFHETARLQMLVDEMQRVTGVREVVERSSSVLMKLRATTAPVDPAPLSSMIGLMESIGSEMEQHRQSLGALTEELAATEQCIREWASENPICQICGAPVDPERLLAGVPVHE